jgi:TIR domain
MANATVLETDKSKAKVFISYSRKDIAFADQLDAALKARGFETLIDRTDILAFEEWWKRVEVLIARADTVVFALSPDAVRPGTVTLKEVEFAASLNKRFAPIVFRPVEDKSVPEALAKLNFIFFDEATRFEHSADQLAEALNTDIGWIRQHTDLGEQARRWAQAKGASGLLLRSPVLEHAERWIASRPPGAPAPNEETQAFIRRSRQGAIRRRNVLTGSLAAGLVLALALAGLAYWQRGIAVEQRGVAQKNEAQANEALALARKNESRGLAALSSVAAKNGSFVDSIALALAGWPRTSSDPRPRLPVVLESLVYCLSNLVPVIGEYRHDGVVNGALLNRDETRIVSWSDDKTVRIWDVATGRQIGPAMTHKGAIYGALLNRDETRIVSWSDDGAVRLWDVATGQQIGRAMTHDSWLNGALLSRDETRIVSWSADKTVRIWDVATGRQIGPSMRHDNAVYGARLNRRDTRILSWSGDETVRLWDVATGRQIGPAMTHDDGVNGALLNRDETHILSWSADGTVRLWEAETGRQNASSTRSGDARAGRIHSRTFTGTSGSCACAGLGTTCRG